MYSSGKLRTTLLHIPPSYQIEQPLPLVLNFHGTNNTSADQANLSQMSPLADKESFIVAYPQSLGKEIIAWNLEPEINEDIVYVHNLLLSIQRHCSIDKKRIYVSGMSNGGGMANRVACDMADVFAAAAPVAGAYPYPGICHPSAPISIIAFHGTADEKVPYQGSGSPELLNQYIGVLAPVHEWISLWAARNGCNKLSRIIDIHPNVFAEAWQKCRYDTEVVFYTLEQGAHDWDNGKVINVSKLIWIFFKSHPKPDL